MKRALLLCLAASLPAAAAPPQVSLIIGREQGMVARYGWGKLKQALQAKGVLTEEVAVEERAKGTLLVQGSVMSGKPAESLEVRKGEVKGRKTLFLSGGDEVGLMYALLDAAGRVAWAPDASDPFSEVREVAESPAIENRALSIYTMQRVYFESRLHNEDYWQKYFDLMARNRFNMFVLIFGYECDGLYAPAYPYFFDVEGFPDVRVVQLSKDQQERELKALNRMIDLAHERGIRFKAALWDHIFRGGVQGSNEFAGKPTPGLVWGLSEKNLTAYHVAALEKFLKLVPKVDALQFRMHGESGLKRQEMRDFWGKMYQVVKTHGHGMRFDARAKEFPDDLIDLGLETGLNFGISTKYWAEQMGLPFHPTHIQRGNQFDRRHGYSDLLVYPQRYKMNWRLWNGGTTRLLLWGDPDYARRFVDSAGIYSSDGYEVNEPLATKMLGQPHDAPVFDILRPQYRYYEYEFERYWHFFQVFGRLGYNPETPAEVWSREFERRFGREAASSIAEALHKASKVLPRIVAYSMPAGKFPTTRGWAERQRMDDLPAYVKADPSDTQQFLSFAEAAQNLLDGKPSAKIHPLATARWFENTAKEVLGAAAEAEAKAVRSKELVSTLIDLRILANLALYHARRIPAGLGYALYEKTGDLNALDDAIAHERSAITAWQGIVTAAGDAYDDNLRFGIPRFDLSGHWKDELVKLNAGLTALVGQRRNAQVSARKEVGRFQWAERRQSTLTTPMPDGAYQLEFQVSDPAGAVGPMWIEANGRERTDTFTVAAGQTVTRILETTVADGKLNIALDSPSTGNSKLNSLKVVRVAPLVLHVPVRRLQPGQDLTIRATVAGIAEMRNVALRYRIPGQGFRRLAMAKQEGPVYRASVPAAELGAEGHYYLEAEDISGRAARTEAVTVRVTADTEPPSIAHAPVRSAAAGKPLSIQAMVSDASGVGWVRLRYRGVDQHQDYAALEMLAEGESGLYRAEVPASHVRPERDFMYFIETVDRHGNGRIYPDLEKETPYVVVKLERR